MNRESTPWLYGIHSTISHYHVTKGSPIIVSIVNENWLLIVGDERPEKRTKQSSKTIGMHNLCGYANEGQRKGARRCGMEISSISVDDDALAKQSPHWNSPIASVKWMTHSQRDRHRENSGAIRLLLIRMEKFFTGCSCFQKENLKVKKKNSCFLLKKAHLWSALRLKTNLLDLPYNLYRFLGVWLELFQYLSYKACI